MTDASMTIIALHGNGGGGFRFERLHPFVPTDVVLDCPTLPGFSDKPRDPQLVTLKDFAECIHPIVQSHSRPIILLGHGIGGSLALDYLQRHSGAVDGVILHAPVGASLDTRWFPNLLRLPFVADAGKMIFASRFFRGYFTGKLFKYPAPSDYLDRFFEEYANCRVFKQMFFLIKADWFASLRKIDIPAALLWGGLDNVLKIGQLQAFTELFDKPFVVEKESWDHFPMVDMPEEYSKEIIRIARHLIKKTHTAD